MGNFEFLGVIATFAVVVVWYIQNTERDRNGDFGWLAIALDPAERQLATVSSYSVKERTARRRYELRDVDGLRAAGGQSPKPSYRVLDEETHRSRRSYRPMDESRYKTAGSAERYSKRDGAAAKFQRQPVE